MGEVRKPKTISAPAKTPFNPFMSSPLVPHPATDVSTKARGYKDMEEAARQAKATRAPELAKAPAAAEPLVKSQSLAFQIGRRLAWGK